MATTAEAPPVVNAASPMPEGKLVQIAIEQLFESQWNPRQFYPQTAMDELVESMRASGFHEWLPLMVRPRAEGGFEIGAGHRRSRAARAAGITVVPCIVREMTDEQFLDVLNFDNSNREDVHPLHESAGWQQYMQQAGKGVLDIVAKTGHSKEIIYQRLKFSSLIDDAKKAFLDGEFGAGHAILIARLQPAEQKIALQYAIKDDWQHRRPGVRDLARFVHQDIHLEMDRACFDQASADLVPAAGSCNACPKRTRNNRDLLLPIEQADDPEQDDCTDPGCFQSKVDAHLVHIKASLEAKGQKPIEISTRYTTKTKKVIGASGYSTVSSGTKGSVVAVVAEGRDIGSVVHVLIKPPQQSASNANASSQKQAKLNPEAAKKAEEARKAKEDLELSIRRAILDQIRAKVTSISRVDLEVLLPEILHNADYDGELARMHGKEFDGYLGGEQLKKVLAGLRDAEIFQLAVELPLLEDLQDFRINQEPEILLAGAKRYKVDATKIRIQMETAAKAPAAASESKPLSDKKPPVVPPPSKKAAAKKKAAAPKPAAKKKAAKK